MIQFRSVSLSYDGQPAIQDVSFDVERGELFGLIGPDGAGKSTLMRILTTVLLPDSGQVLFDGHDVVADYRYVRTHVGYMPGRFSLYQDLSVRENLTFFATIFGTTVDENREFIEEIYAQLVPFEDRRAGALSGGMKQKLALSCALIHRPQVLVLDEPTFGVDAVSRSEFWKILRALEERGVTILVSTPYMDEAALCDRVALLQKGRILNIDTPAGIIAQFDKRLIEISTRDIYRGLRVLATLQDVDSFYSFGQTIHLYADDALDPAQLTATLQQHGLEDVIVRPGTPNVEDCFMDLMVRSDRDTHVVD